MVAAAPLASAQTFAYGGGGGALESSIETVYYDVEGTSLNQIGQSLRQRGPVTGGKTFFGLTEWSLNTNYNWVERDTGCSIEDLVVRIGITITMPRWDAPAGAPHELLQTWNRFKHSLREHEHGHARLAQEAADAVRWELATLRYPTCANAEFRARQRVAEIVQEYNRRNEHYDRVTSHGTTEGAVWPPRQGFNGSLGR